MSELFDIQVNEQKVKRKTRAMDIKQLQVNDYSCIEGTVCLVNE